MSRNICVVLKIFLRRTPTHTHTHTPVDWADTGHAVIVTHSLCQQSVSDLPGKHGGVLAFVISDFVDDFGCSNLWFGASDHPWSDAASLIVPVEQIESWISPGKINRELEHMLILLCTSLMPCGQRTLVSNADTEKPVITCNKWSICSVYYKNITQAYIWATHRNSKIDPGLNSDWLRRFKATQKNAHLCPHILYECIYIKRKQPIFEQIVLK